MERTKYQARDATKIRQQIAEANSKNAEGWWELASLLWQAYYGVGPANQPLFKLWGFEDWYSYTELEVGMHVTTASRMVSTYHFFHIRMGKSWDGTVLSPARMKAISGSSGGTVTPKNVNHWIGRAQGMTPCELEAELSGKERKVSLSLSLAASDAERLRKYLDDAIEGSEYENRGEAIMALLGLAKRRTRAA